MNLGREFSEGYIKHIYCEGFVRNIILGWSVGRGRVCGDVCTLAPFRTSISDVLVEWR
jgi:hypothetical protein